MVREKEFERVMIEKSPRVGRAMPYELYLKLLREAKHDC
jgi:hypothetical protein